MNPTTKIPLTKDNPILPEVWITKYALTKGVYKALNAEHCRAISERMISLEGNCFHTPDWHTTEDAARARVLEMVDAELSALARKRAKMEKLKETFSSAPEIPTLSMGQD